MATTEKDIASATDSMTEEAREMKSQGYIVLDDQDSYALRVRIPGGRWGSEDHSITRLVEIAQKYGTGEVSQTLRLGVEIPGVSGDDLEDAREEVEEAGFVLAGCGPFTRPLKVCKGDVCPYGLVDVKTMGEEFDEEFFDDGERYPHKYKIGISGCPIGCVKPQTEDVGFFGLARPGLDPDACIDCGLCEDTCRERSSKKEGWEHTAWEMQPTPDDPDHDELPVYDEEMCIDCGECIRACPTEALYTEKSGLKMFVGGKWGRHPRMADEVASFIDEKEAKELTRATGQWYKENGESGERLASVLDRVGAETFTEEVVEPVLNGEGY